MVYCCMGEKYTSFLKLIYPWKVLIVTFEFKALKSGSEEEDKKKEDYFSAPIVGFLFVLF